MSLKSDITHVSRGTGQVSGEFFLYDFARWYRGKTHAGPPIIGILEILDELAERSEDFLEQEYARFLIEQGELDDS